jgi:hypothetical protein
VAVARGGVFINYRGEDSRSYAALLHAELTRRFGPERVFLDAESIPAGADYVARLLDGVRQARVVLAVIGARWLDAADSHGGRHLDNPADWVRRELVAAFDAGVRVIPVLTDGLGCRPRRSCLRSWRRWAGASTGGCGTGTPRRTSPG